MRQIKHRPHYTIEDYNHWEGDWELIDGIPYSMSPSPVMKHQRLLSILLRKVGNEIEEKPNCKECFEVADLDWIINDEMILRPDLAIICENYSDYITKPPVFIVEIISPSTALKDRQTKFEIYQEQGVQYYIIVDPNSKSFSIFNLVMGTYMEQNELKDFNIHGDCSINIDLTTILSNF